MLNGLTNQLRESVCLSDEQVGQAVSALTSEAVSAEEKAQFLTALAEKGETVAELTVFARELRRRAIRPPIAASTRQKEILDVCGTGGDGLNTFNISSTVALIAAAAGIPVAKHGNRAVTSRSGSADVLETLGVPIDLSPEAAARSLEEHHFAFFFAPRYHPSFREIAPARKLCAARGQRTIFNLLGPLLNPAEPSVQLVGVPDARWCEPIGRVLQCLGLRRAMVVSGQAEKAWLDELSILGDNMIAEFYQDRAFSSSLVKTAGFEFAPAQLSDLVGGSREANAELVVRLLDGRERGPKRDAVLLNAGAAIFLGGKAKSLADGFELAAELIESGRAAAKLRDLAESRER